MKNGKEHTRSVSSPNNAASSYARSASVSSPSPYLTSISLHSIAPHHTNRPCTHFSFLSFLLSFTRLVPTELPSPISIGTALFSSSPSLGQYRLTPIFSVPRTNFSFLLFFAINPLSLVQTLASHGLHHNLHSPCHSRSPPDFKAHGPCHHPLGTCHHLTEHKKWIGSIERNQDWAQAALRAQTLPPDHTPASSSESSQSVQWSAPSSARSPTPQPAPSPARHDSEESDHLSGHYTDRAAEHEPNYFSMPTRRMFERF